MEAITAGLMPLVGGLQQQAGLPTMGTCDKGLGRGLELIQRLEPMQAGLMAPMTLQGKRVDGSTTKQQHRGCRHRQWHHEATAPLQHQPLSESMKDQRHNLKTRLAGAFPANRP